VRERIHKYSLLGDDIIDMLKSKAEEKGFDTSKMIFTDQSCFE